MSWKIIPWWWNKETTISAGLTWAPWWISRYGYWLPLFIPGIISPHLQVRNINKKSRLLIRNVTAYSYSLLQTHIALGSINIDSSSAHFLLWSLTLAEDHCYGLKVSQQITAFITKIQILLFLIASKIYDHITFNFAAISYLQKWDYIADFYPLMCFSSFCRCTFGFCHSPVDFRAHVRAYSCSHAHIPTRAACTCIDGRMTKAMISRNWWIHSFNAVKSSTEIQISQLQIKCQGKRNQLTRSIKTIDSSEVPPIMWRYLLPSDTKSCCFLKWS